MARKTLPPEQLSADTGHLTQALNEGTDLACALIGAAAIEQALGSLLEKYLLAGGTTERLLDPNGILGTFSARTDMAYCLGLISKKILHNAKLIGQIRNEFAHSHLSVNFTTKSIADLCKKLTVMELPKPKDEKRHQLNELFDRSTRSRFSFVVTMIRSRLLLTALATEHRESNNTPDAL